MPLLPRLQISPMADDTIESMGDDDDDGDDRWGGVILAGIWGGLKGGGEDADGRKEGRKERERDRSRDRNSSGAEGLFFCTARAFLFLLPSSFLFLSG